MGLVGDQFGLSDITGPCVGFGQPDRITFKQKVTLEDSEPLPVPPNKFWMERGGEVVKVLMGNSLVELEYNYTVWPIAEETANASFGLLQTTLLTTTGGNCLQAVASQR